MLTGCLAGVALKRSQKKEVKASAALKEMTVRCETLSKEVEDSRSNLLYVTSTLETEIRLQEGEIRSLKSNLLQAHAELGFTHVAAGLFATPECPGAVVRVFENARYSIHLLCFSFDHPDVIKAAIKARERGVRVKIVGSMDMLRQTRDMPAAFATLFAHGVEIKVSSKRQHIKAVASDIYARVGEEPDGVEALLTGSWNFTEAAMRNFEFLILNSLIRADGLDNEKDVGKQFRTIFQAIWSAETSQFWNPDKPIEEAEERSDAHSGSSSRRGRQYNVR
jgi:hypothetical protein